MSDEIKNWYSKVKGTGLKRDKNYSKHMIEPNSMIVCIGGSGSGKSTSVIEFMSRCDGFYEILLFSGSGNSQTEPLYKLLLERCPGVQCFDDINEFPDLETFEKDLPKLAIFDDFMQLSPKQMKKLNQYVTAGRKSSFSCIFMAQSYTHCPKIISRNAHYFWLFKLNDNRSIDTIARNHNQHDIKKDDFIKLHQMVTSFPRNFLNIDLKNRLIKRNFTDVLEECS